MTLVTSLTTPIDRAMGTFNFLMTIFGILLLGSMGGIIYYLIQTGFYPEHMHYNIDTK